MNRWLKLQICLLVGAFMVLHGSTLNKALNGLKEDPYGFALIDVGITEEDLANFRCIDIQGERFYHQFGELEKVQEEITDFFIEVGSNQHAVALQAGARLAQIVNEVVEASGKEAAWVHLRASIPTDRYDLPRWHMDGYYYIPEGPEDLLFKFAATLMGPPTLFYLLPPELRKLAKTQMCNREYMKQFCQVENIVTPRIGEGAIFLGGRGVGVAALHSEPPIHENRLFFSIVPCTKKQLVDLKERVLAVYPKDSRR